MKEPRPLAVWQWGLIGIALMYGGLTLAAATIATPPTTPDALSSGIQRLAMPLAQALPGAGLWPRVMDMNGKIGGTFPTPMAGVFILVLASLGAMRLAKGIRDQLRKDAATAHDEAIREQVRQGTRRP